MLETSRIHTSVSTDTKIRWEHFLLTHHDTIRGEYGPELERAMNYYMDKFNQNPNNEQPTKINKTTRSVLKLISAAFRDLPSYPTVAPIIINAVIKDNVPRKDNRTQKNYMKLVIPHLKPHISEDGSAKNNVQGFCEYVDRLTNESALK